MSQSLPTCDLAPPQQPYDCNNPYPDCINPYGFQFSSLWTITNYVATCATDSRLFDSTAPSLTLDACENFVGTNSFTPYSLADLYARIATWKFPLIQLVTQFPRPPLSKGTEALVVAHLLGDPIGTLKSLLLKIACGQARADYWIARFDRELRCLIQEERKDACMTRAQAWKALALIVSSYDEWGFEKGQEVQDFLCEQLSLEAALGEKSRLLLICRKTAKDLAADRSTTFLPTVTSLIIFMGSIAIAFARTPSAAEGDNPSTYINIEAHSIAFTAMYFWLIPSIILACMIGVSNTKESIPNHLLSFEQAIDRYFISNTETSSQNTSPHQITKLTKWRLFDSDSDSTFIGPPTRKYAGIYSWQPEDLRRDIIKRLRPPKTKIQTTSFVSRIIHFLIPAPGSLPFSTILFLTSQATGLLISSLVPPLGFWCRDWLEFSMTIFWLLGTTLNQLPSILNITSSHHSSLIFYFVLTKDSVLAAVNLGIVIATQVGTLNRCSCYSRNGETGLAFPEVEGVKGVLVRGIEVTYPAVAFGGIFCVLVVLPGGVVWRYKDAFRVFLQRDDGGGRMEGF